jgi:hypothetical protein
MEDQYNKKENKGALIGNWVEERALHHDTGETRYRQWEDSVGEEGPRDDSVVGKRWTKGGEKADQNDSFRRCFVHMDRDEYGDIQTFYESSFKNPEKEKGPGVTREYRSVGEGTRSRLSQEEMWDLAKKSAEEQAEQENQNILDEPLVSTTQEAYQAPPPAAYTKPLGKRVMRTRDGRDIPDDTRDLTFLVESGIRHPDTRLEYKDASNTEEPPAQHAGDLYNSVAITHYTAPKLIGTDHYQGRTGKTNFGRPHNESFSMPIEFTTATQKA